MNKEYLKNKTILNFWDMTILLTWILVKLTVVASMTRKIAVEFVYAGF